MLLLTAPVPWVNMGENTAAEQNRACVASPSALAKLQEELLAPFQSHHWWGELCYLAAPLFSMCSTNLLCLCSAELFLAHSSGYIPGNGIFLTSFGVKWKIFYNSCILFVDCFCRCFSTLNCKESDYYNS